MLAVSMQDLVAGMLESVSDEYQGIVRRLKASDQTRNTKTVVTSTQELVADLTDSASVEASNIFLTVLIPVHDVIRACIPRDQPTPVLEHQAVLARAALHGVQVCWRTAQITSVCSDPQLCFLAEILAQLCLVIRL